MDVSNRLISQTSAIVYTDYRDGDSATKASSDESLRWRFSPEAAFSRDSLTAEGGFRPKPHTQEDNLTAEGGPVVAENLSD